MLKILFIALFLVVLFTGMALALHFSQYKKRAGSCCGGGHCDTHGGGEHHTCHSRALDVVEKHAAQK